MKLLRVTKNTLGNDALDAIEASDYIREEVVTEAVQIAIIELEAVEREIGVPSKALPLLRALLA